MVNDMSKPILHADFMSAYAQGEVVEWMPADPSRNQTWRAVETTFSIGLFNRTDFKFRIKPKTILINGIEVPEPVRNESQLAEGQLIYIADPNRDSKVDFWRWDQDLKSPRKFLERGLIHLTQEAAEIHARALLSFTAKDE